MSVSLELLAVRDAIALAMDCRPVASFDFPVTVKSEANRRDRWGAVRRAAAQRRAVELALKGPLARFRSGWGFGDLNPLVVRLVRVAPRRLDTDNLARALKAVRDGVATALGVDDGGSEVVWLPDQLKPGAGYEPGVLVEVYTGGRGVRPPRSPSLLLLEEWLQECECAPEDMSPGLHERTRGLLSGGREPGHLEQPQPRPLSPHLGRGQAHEVGRLADLLGEGARAADEDG